MKRNVVLLALLVLAGTLAGSGWASPSTTPRPGLPTGPGQTAAGAAERISNDWRRVRTAHFEAVSNAPAEKVSEILIQLEAFHRFLVTDILALKTTSPVPTVVFIFKDAGSFSKFTPRRADGSKDSMSAYFAQAPDMDYIVMPAKLEGADPLRLIYHEYYHFVISRNFPGAPTWLNEGLAEFFSTYEVDPTSGQCNIGRPIDDHVLWLREEKLLPLEQMIPEEGAVKLVRSKDPERVALFYAQSWALVHYFMISQNTQRQPQLKEYLEVVKKGLPAEQAFKTAFRMSFAEMQKELKAYIANKNFYMMRFSWKPEELLAASTVEAMTEIEAEYLQEDLRMRLGTDPNAEEGLRRILARSPSYVPAKISLGALLARRGQLSEAIEMLRPIAEGDRANFRTHLALAEAYAKGKLYEDAVREYRGAAAANDQSPDAWLGITMATAILGRPAESDAAMERLQALKASPDWFDARAYEAFKAGFYAAAVADARTYIQKAGRGDDSSPYMAFLGALCLLKLGQVPESDKLLEEVRPGIPADSWTMKVMDFLQGRTTEDKFLSLAKDVNERTEAHGYAGLKASIAGQRSQAVKHLRWVKDNGTKNFVEYGMAVAELKRLEADSPPQPLGALD